MRVRETHERKLRGEEGFTLLELIITLLILAILSVGTVPIARNVIKREREQELKRTLREVRSALDRYHVDCIEGKILTFEREKPEKDGCYPASLEKLYKGVQKAGPGGLAGSGEILRYLRRPPVDPMTGRDDDWILRSPQDEPDSIGGGESVYDIHSSSGQMAINGTYYKDW